MGQWWPSIGYVLVLRRVLLITLIFVSVLARAQSNRFGEIPLSDDQKTKDLLGEVIKNTDIVIPDVEDATVLEEVAGQIKLPSTTRNGITCTPNPVERRTLNCIAKPLLINKGDKIYAAKEASFIYKQGEGIAQIDVVSKDLFITDLDSSTKVSKSETELGDTGISVIARGSGIGGTPTVDSIDNVEEANDFRIIANSSKLIHRVSNPNDQNDKRVKLQVREGVQGTLNISQSDDDRLSFQTEGLLKGGVTYDSDPFSDNKVTAKSDSTLGVSFSLLEGESSNRAIFAASSVAGDENSGQSELILTDTRDPNRKNNFVAKGDTSIVVAQETSKDSKPTKTSFMVSSEELILSSRDKDNKGQTLVLESLEVSAEENNVTGVSRLGVKADSASLIDDKKNTAAIARGDVSIDVLDNGQATIAGVSADQVVVSTNDFDFDASGGVSISAIKHKDPKTKIDGKKVTGELVATADTVKIRQNGKLANISGGTTVYVASLEDGSTVQTVSGEQGVVTDRKFEVSFSENATVVNKFDDKQELTSSTVSVTNLSGSNRDGTSFNVTNSLSSLQTIGKASEGQDILQLTHQSETFSAKNDEHSAQVNNLNAVVVDAHADRYGVVSFDKAEIKGLPKFSDDKITLNEGVVSFYENEKIQQGNLVARELKLERKDYKVNISAIGKDGKSANFNIFYIKKGDELFASVFTEDGEKVQLEGADKDGNFADILAKSVDYYKNDEFQTLLVKEAQGSLESEDSEYAADFEVAKIEAFETEDGTKKAFVFHEGSLSAVSNKDGIEADFGFQKMSYSSLGEKDGDSISVLSFEDGDFSAREKDEGLSASGEFDLMDFYQGNDLTVGSIVGGNNLSFTSAKPGEDTTNLTFDGLDANGVSSDKIKYGTITFDSMSATQIPVGESEVDARITIQDGAMVFYENKEDPDHLIREGKASATSLSGSHQDYTLGVTAIGDDGTPGKFNIFYLEEGNEKTVQVFGENGQRVHITGSEKDKNFGDVLFRTASAYENENVKQFLVTELEAKATDISPSGTASTASQLSIARVAGYQAKDGSLDHFQVDQASINHEDFKKKQVFGATTERATFTKTNYLGTISTNLEAYNTSINVKDYSDKSDLVAEVNMGSILYNSVETPDSKNMSFVRVNDIEFLAMDYNEMISATGNIGEVSRFENDEMTVIDVKDLQNMKVDSLKEDMSALFNGKRFLKVDTRDSSGKVISSYLLVNDATLNIKGSTDSIKGEFNLNARVFEFVKDEVTGDSRIVKADVDFNARAELSDHSFVPALNLSGALKGENITTSSSKFESKDGRVHGGTFSINADKLQHLSLKAKVGFIDLASFEAKGENGKSINYSYTIDESQGVITLRGVYKDGDSLKTKFLFFKLGSHKEGNDAVQSLGIYLKGQSVEDHMRIMSEMASIKQVNSFFGVSDGGAISLTAGAGDKGFALELLVVNEKWAFNDSDKYKSFKNPTNSVGINVKYIKEDNSTWGAGLALTSDSKVNFDGDLRMFNQRVESLPTTLNFNVSHTNAEGDLGIVGGLHVPLTSYVLDTDKLDSDAQFFDNGRRKANGPGAHLAVTKKFEDSELRFSGGMFNNFREPAVAITYQGTPEVLANLGRGIINVASGEPFDKGFSRNKKGRSRYLKQKQRNEFIRDEQIRELEAKRMVVVEKKVDELIEHYSQMEGFFKVKEVLKIAKDYLTNPINPRDFRKDIFGFGEKDMIEYRFYEKDPHKVQELEGIILALIENKIMVQLPLEHESRLSMYDIYKKRRYYMNLDVIDELNKINEAGVEPCEYFMMRD